MSEQPELIARLLDAERQRMELPPEQVDSLWRETAALVTAGSATAATTATAAGTGLLKLVGVALVAFGGGVLAGRASVSEDVAAPQLARVTPEVSQHLAQPIEPPARALPATLPSATNLAPRTTPPTTPTRAAPAASSSAAPVGKTASLQEERVLVEGARTALLRGRPADALTLAKKHRSQFPAGQLAEDRDFIIATALARLGRTGEAQQSAKDFADRYPQSTLRSEVDPLLDPSPSAQP